MKANRLFLATLALLCFSVALTGCSAAMEEERPPVTVTVGVASETVVSSVPGLSLITEENEYSSPDIKVRYALQNETDTTYCFGAMDMSMEVLQDGEWHRLALRTDVRTAVTGDAIGIGPNAGTEAPHFFTTSFFEYGDIVPAGTYRLVIKVSTEDDPSVEEYLAAEFDVTE